MKASLILLISTSALMTGLLACANVKVEVKSLNSGEYDAQQEYSKGKEGKLEGNILKTETRDIDYNYTLHSPYLKHKVLQMADILANAGLFAAAGYVRDHKKGIFIFIDHPPIDKRVVLKQSHRLKRMGRALKRTHDDDYRLAGDILYEISEAIVTDDVSKAKRQVLLLEEFYKEDITRSLGRNSGDDGILRDITDKTIGNIIEAVESFSKAIQNKVIKTLNLQNVIEGSLL